MPGPGSEKMIVKLATAGHNPYDTRIFHKEAHSLVDAGYQVSLVIPRKDLREEEIAEGVRILPVDFPKNGIIKLLITPLKVWQKARQFPRQAVIHLHDSELLLIGILLKLSGHRVIYDAHEDTPLQIRYQHWIPEWFKPVYAGLYYRMEKICGRLFDHIIVAEPVIEKYYPPEKTSLIRNFPIVSPFRAKANSEKLPERKNQALYIGSITEARGIHEMVKAVELAAEQVEVKLALAGRFHPPALQDEICRSSVVDFLGWATFDRMLALNFESKVGIIVPRPVERYQTNYPVKMFEYMSAGLPVIIAKDSVSSEFVRESRSGLIVDPLSPEEIAGAIVYLLEHEEEALEMGRRGQQMVFEKYNWEMENRRLLSLYEHLFKPELS
jgi:glycosyltransferase involved in cell wall biosynthesis